METKITTQLCSWGWIDFTMKTTPVLFWIFATFAAIYLLYICFDKGLNHGFYRSRIDWFDNWRVIYIMVFALLGILAAYIKFTDNDAFYKYLECLKIFFEK